MLFDWFTIFAQAINFLILLWLLKRFLFGPIMRAMRSRGEALAKNWREAEQAKERAEAESKALAGRRRELEEIREDILAAARREAEGLKTEELEGLRREMRDLRMEWTSRLAAEKKEFYRNLEKRILEQAAHIAEKALKDLADEDLQSRLQEVFLRNLSPEAFGDEKAEKALVRSGIPLTDMLQTRFAQALKARLPELAAVEFEHAPDLAFGVELCIGGRRLCWNLSRYMGSLRTAFQDALMPEGKAAG